MDKSLMKAGEGQSWFARAKRRFCDPAKKRSALSTAFLGVMLSATLVAPMAYAAPLEGAGNEPSSNAQAAAPADASAFDAYKVPAEDIVNPAGTTVNLFDYWFDGDEPTDHATWTGADANVNPNQDPTIWTTGINDGHIFKFAGKGMDKYNPDGLNSWTGSAAPHYGIVKKNLVDGFPVLEDNFHTDELQAESLAYLFNADDYHSAENAIPGKKAHADVKGLLQMDDEGYYYYQGGDSNENGVERKGNFAAYNEATNSFDLYQSFAVFAHNNAPDGMFFPFNTADQVFEIKDGVFGPKKSAKCDVEPMNHFFGMTMKTRFMQSNGGLTDQGKDVTYEFKGDDDVWVFIDGVLVGDLGGRHDAASLKIDFRTGKVFVNGAEHTTIKASYEAAGQADKTQWSGDTFADETVHTLQFFYLERGAYASNLALRFNLPEIPASELQKVDQYGNAVEGAEFSLYKADENYAKQGDAITTAVTNEQGALALLDSEGNPLSFDLLHAEGADHFVLEETPQSAGSEYRTMEPLNLRYVKGATGSGIVVADNSYDTGAVTNAKATLQIAAGNVKHADGTPVELVDGKVAGTMFAVPMKKQDDGSWRAVYGSALDGWNLASSASEAGAIEVAQKGFACAVEPAEGTMYKGVISELPGSIESYYSMLPENEQDKAEYAIAYYLTTADSLEGATEGNTEPLKSSEFSSRYAAKLSVPNVYNRVMVQKVDEAGNPINGATFGLFKAEDGFESQDEPGTYRINEGAAPIATAQTATLVREKDGIDLEGAAVFNGRMDANGDGADEAVLEVGKMYYIAETVAPDEYDLNDHAARVLVSGKGVFADAGIPETADGGDGIKVLREVGMLLDTMSQYAENPAIEATLHDITAQLQVTTEEPGTNADIEAMGWQPKGDTLHLNYGSDNALVDYGSNDASVSPLQGTDEGWSRTVVKQCMEEGHGMGGSKEDLGDMNLAQLFSGVAIVQVTDSKTPNDFKVAKAVEGYDGMDSALLEKIQKDKEFTFDATFKVPGADGATVPLPDGYSIDVFDANGKIATYDIVAGSASFALKHGQYAEAKGLPVATQYEIVETAADGFTASSTLKGDGVASGAKVSGTLADSDATDQGMTSVEVAYSNKYSAQPTTAVLGAQKTLDGRDFAAGEFSFKLVGVSAPDGVGIAPVQHKTNGAPQDGVADVVFDALTFSKPGTYTYEIVEVAGDAGGVTYDTVKRDAQVVVTDDGSGKLVAAVTYGGKAERPVIENVYTATPVSDAPSAVKTVEATDGNDFQLAAGQFGFTLEAVSAPEGVVLATSQTKANDARGNVEFDSLSFTAPGTYTFRLTENDIDADKTPGVSKDPAVYTIVYEVEDDGQGALGIAGKTVTADGKAPMDTTQGIPFVNTYDPAKAVYAISGVKSIDNSAAGTNRIPLDGEFSFTLTAIDGAPMPADAVDGVQTVTNTGATFTFGSISYDKPGTYKYEVSEVAGADASISYDAASYEVVVTVTDTGGKLTASADKASSDIAFVNAYAPAAAEIVLDGMKELTGRDMAEGEFSFVLFDDQGAELQTASNVADGSFAFAPLTFDKTGTYHYQVAEVQGNAGGVTYDGTVYSVTIEVTDDADARKLAATATVSVAGEAAEGIVFKNAYKAVPAKAVLGAKKVLEGRSLKAGEFFFELRENGETITTATNATPDGNGYAPVLFELEFTEAGEHTYEIVEVKGDAEGVTYDETVHTATVTVEDNLEGLLEVNVTYDEGSIERPVFKNVYDKPGEPEDPGTPGGPGDPGNPGNPGGPGTPGDPGNPGQPAGPSDQGSNGGNGASSGQGGSYAQTNDGSLVLMAGVAVMAVAAIGLVVVALIMRKRQ